MPDKPVAQTITPEALAREFDALVARARLSVPAERRASVLAAYADLRGQMALLSTRYAYTSEPANVFRLAPVERG